MLTLYHCRFVLEVNRVVNNGDVSEVAAACVCVCVCVFCGIVFFFSVSKRRQGDTNLHERCVRDYHDRAPGYSRFSMQSSRLDCSASVTLNGEKLRLGILDESHQTRVWVTVKEERGVCTAPPRRAASGAKGRSHFWQMT